MRVDVDALDFGLASGECGFLTLESNRAAFACYQLRKATQMRYELKDNCVEAIAAMVTVADKIYIASGSRVFCYDTKHPEDGATQMMFRTIDERGAPGGVTWTE